MKVLPLCLIVPICALAATSCSSSSPSGFLDDYDQLEPGKNLYGAKLSYTNPTADFSKYDSIMFEPVVFILPEDSKLTEQDKLRLVNAARKAVREELGQDYKLATKPAPNVMLWRGALTELTPANRPVNMFTSVVPFSRIISEGQYWTTGISSFSARGTGEFELRDSVSNERLAALSDTRYARKQATTSATKWGEIEKAMKRSASDIRKGLARLRNRQL